VNAQAWIAVAAFLVGIIIKLAHDVGKLEGEMGAMSRVLEADRRETHRAVGCTPNKAKSFVRHFLKTDEQ